MFSGIFPTMVFYFLICPVLKQDVKFNSACAEIVITFCCSTKMKIGERGVFVPAIF